MSTRQETYENLFRDCFEQSKKNELVKEKAHWVSKLLPAKRLVDIGGMWGCNGFYSFSAAAEGAEEVLLLDGFITNRFSEINQNFSNVRYIKINFYESMLTGEFMTLGNKYPADAAICYDILLHMPDPIRFIANIIDSFAVKRAVFANPVIRKSTKRSDLFFVPFSSKFKKEGEIKHSTNIHDTGGWVWVFSHGFLLNCMKYLNLYVVEETLIRNWSWGKRLDYSLIIVERK